MRINSLLLLPLFLFPLLLVGCANKSICEPVVQVEYVEVKIPVSYRLTRPERPKFTDSQPVPIYVKELTTYTEILEKIIDGTKK